jgi:metal-dependent hydrolase (beta-lactamase superfamily II)
METPLNTYQTFFVEVHPSIKSDNPTWTPQQITTEIGKRWSLRTMTIDTVNDTVCVQYSKRKIVIDGCSHPNVLQLYLHAYREKYGDEALLILAEHMELKAQ